MRDKLAASLFAIAAIAAIGLIPAWRGGTGRAGGAYPLPPEQFAEKADAMIAQYATGRLIDGLPVVRPPAGDIYLKAERWQFSPALELEAGRAYRLHVSSVDVTHSLVLAGSERLLIPGRVEVVELPGEPVALVPQCAEYCGLGHYKMKGSIEMVTP